MTRRLFRAAFVTALLAASLAGTATAQPKPALVQDRDEPGRSPYQELVSSITCSLGCSWEFATVPAGKRLVVQHVGVELQLDEPPTPIVNLSLQTSGAASYMPLQWNVYGNAVFVTSQPVTFFVEAGARPVVRYLALGTATITRATLTGYFVSLP